MRSGIVISACVATCIFAALYFLGKYYYKKDQQNDADPIPEDKVQHILKLDYDDVLNWVRKQKETLTGKPNLSLTILPKDLAHKVADELRISINKENVIALIMQSGEDVINCHFFTYDELKPNFQDMLSLNKAIKQKIDI